MSIPRALRSSRLALGLCLAIAVWAALGTFVPAERAEQFVQERLGAGPLAAARALGLVDTYASPVFIGLLLALVANVAACSWYRSRTVQDSSRRGRVRLALDLLAHFSVLLVLAGGAVKGALGSAWTQYLFLGRVSTTAREDGTGPERPLGYGLLLKEIVEDHFPLALQVGLRDASTGEDLGMLTVREGRGAEVPGRDLRLEVGEHDVGRGWVTVRFSGRTAGSSGGERRFDVVADGRTSARIGPCDVQLLAWRRDLRRVRGRIAIIEGGREVGEAWLGSNDRIAWRGSSVFLSAWGEDEYRNRFVGVQVTRDPGAPIFWTGAVLFSLAMPLFVVLRHAGASHRSGSAGGGDA